MTNREIGLHLGALALLIVCALSAYAYLHSRYAVPALVRAIESNDEKTRHHSAASLARLGPEARPAVEALLRLAQPDRKLSDRTTAASALIEISPAAAHSLIPHLTEELRHDSAQTRYQAAMVLTELGPLAKAAIPALVNAARDPDEIVRRWAITALGRIGLATQEALSTVIAAVGDRSEVVQHDALIVFSYGHLPRERVAGTSAALRLIAEDPRYAKNANHALRSVEQLRKPEIELLVQTQALKSGGAGLRHTLPALASLGPAAGPALTAIVKVLNDERPLNRYLAIEALAAIGPAAAPALPALQTRLQDEDALVRASASEAIATINTDASKEQPR